MGAGMLLLPAPSAAGLVGMRVYLPETANAIRDYTAIYKQRQRINVAAVRTGWSVKNLVANRPVTGGY